MNTKETKLFGVPMQICTAEKMVAYNICFSIYDLYNNCAPINWNWRIVTSIVSNLKCKYNKDMIQHYVMYNLDRFAKEPHHIFSSKEEVGEFFKSGY